MSTAPLRCARCVAEREQVALTVDAEGLWEGKYGRSDQVYSGGTIWLPAVPDLDGSWWGYTSVPEHWVAWWKALLSVAEPPAKPTASSDGA